MNAISMQGQRGRKVTEADLDRRQAERESHIIGSHGAMKPSRAIRVPSPSVNITTRRFPRSISEAFAAERGQCIDVPQRPFSRLGAIVIGGTVLIALCALGYRLTV
jgi:hypothetical protein